jgi:hypothetical protein
VQIQALRWDPNGIAAVGAFAPFACRFVGGFEFSLAVRAAVFDRHRSGISSVKPILTGQPSKGYMK